MKDTILLYLKHELISDLDLQKLAIDMNVFQTYQDEMFQRFGNNSDSCYTQFPYQITRYGVEYVNLAYINSMVTYHNHKKHFKFNYSEYANDFCFAFNIDTQGNEFYTSYQLCYGPYGNNKLEFEGSPDGAGSCVNAFYDEDDYGAYSGWLQEIAFELNAMGH